MSVQVDWITNKQPAEDTSLSLWQQIKEDWIAHGRDWTLPGFRSVAIHRFGVWRKKIKPKLLQIPFSILYLMLYRRIRNHYGIELLYTVKLGRRVVIHHQGTIIINAYASIPPLMMTAKFAKELLSEVVTQIVPMMRLDWVKELKLVLVQKY